MKYTVVWLPRALAALANLWMHSSDPQEVADASNRLNADLMKDPDKKGIAFGNFLVREDPPLSVMYRVDPGDRMVHVIAVKRI